MCAGDREVQQLARGVFGREAASGLDDLADLAVERFDRVGRVDGAAEVGREREEWRDALPVLHPALGDHRVLGVPGLGEGLELLEGVVAVGGGVDRLEVGRDGLASL